MRCIALVYSLLIDLKRELLSTQTCFEISELSSPTALQRFGHPFRSDAGEVSPEDSDLPLLRYIFVHHVRNFPFLDQAREHEFWQEKLQVVRSFGLAIAALDRLLTEDSSLSRSRRKTYRLLRIGWRKPNAESWRSRQRSL